MLKFKIARFILTHTQCLPLHIPLFLNPLPKTCFTTPFWPCRLSSPPVVALCFLSSREKLPTRGNEFLSHRQIPSARILPACNNLLCSSLSQTAILRLQPGKSFSGFSPARVSPASARQELLRLRPFLRLQPSANPITYLDGKKILFNFAAQIPPISIAVGPKPESQSRRRGVAKANLKPEELRPEKFVFGSEIHFLELISFSGAGFHFRKLYPSYSDHYGR